jgi:hypothetical protein
MGLWSVRNGNLDFFRGNLGFGLCVGFSIGGCMGPVHWITNEWSFLFYFIESWGVVLVSTLGYRISVGRSAVNIWHIS